MTPRARHCRLFNLTIVIGSHTTPPLQCEKQKPYHCQEMWELRNAQSRQERDKKMFEINSYITHWKKNRGKTSFSCYVQHNAVMHVWQSPVTGATDSNVLRLDDAHLSGPNQSFSTPMWMVWIKQQTGNKEESIFTSLFKSIRLEMNLSPEALKKRQITACLNQFTHTAYTYDLNTFLRSLWSIDADLYICSTYMHREGESMHVPPFSQGLFLSTQRNPVEIGEIC